MRPPGSAKHRSLRVATLSTLSLVLALISSGSCTYADAGAPLGGGGGELRIESVWPTPGAQGVRLDPVIEVRFSSPLAPERVGARDLRLFSGVVEWPGHLELDIIERRLRLWPSSDLSAGLRYRVYVRGDLLGLDGSTSGKATVFDFVSGQNKGRPYRPRPRVQSEQLQPLWQERCVACHNTEKPTAGIDLSTVARSEASLLNRPSSLPDVPQVRPGEAARSYLLRKLLGTAGFTGAPMPPSGPLLSPIELRRVADWIDGLAP